MYPKPMCIFRSTVSTISGGNKAHIVRTCLNPPLVTRGHAASQVVAAFLVNRSDGAVAAEKILSALAEM